MQKQGVLTTFGLIDYIKCISPNNKYFNPGFGAQFIPANYGKGPLRFGCAELVTIHHDSVLL
jgi:hypothetical protein